MDALYYESAEVVRQALNKEKSIRSSVYASGFKNKKQLLRLCCETIRCRTFLDGILEHSDIRSLLKKAPLNDHCLLYVLLYELLFGKGLRGVGKRLSAPILAINNIIQQQSDRLKEAGRGVEESSGGNEPVSAIPRYARVNTLKWTFEEALQGLKDEDWEVSEMDDGTDMEVYKTCVGGMKSEQVYIDPHVDNVLIFRSDTDLHNYWMVTDGYLLLQDKASCLPAFLLKPKPNSQAFDVCAAPGMKTSHLAAILGNQGKIWAMDKSSERVQTLRTMLQNAGATNTTVFCGDFLRTDVAEKKFAKVRYALVDPPCSGSGIAKRMDQFVDDSKNVDERRLRSLSNLQAMILKHALKLPNLRRLVYSTCSVHVQENESVIEEVLGDENIKEQFELVNALPSWSHRGDENYEFATKCLRASPSTDLTNGFFVAVFKKKKNKST